MAQSSSFVVSILMLFILLLFTGLLFHIGKHTVSNIYLAVYFISQIIGISNFSFNFHNEAFFLFAQSVNFSWGALFYMFIRSLLDAQYQFRKQTLVHFIPSLIAFVLLGYYRHPVIFESQHTMWLTRHVYLILGILFNTLLIGYNIAAFYQYYSYAQKARKDSGIKQTVPKKWIIISLFGFAISCSIVLLNRPPIQSSVNRDIINNSVFLVFFCVLFYTSIVYKTLTTSYVKKYNNSKLFDEDALRILKILENEMITNKPFTNPELNLKILSESLNISERLLSQAINAHLGQNFSEYINSHRIKYAMELLSNPENKDCTMLSILFDAGFNSKTTFNVTFKKIAGCTPVEFKKKVEQMNSMAKK